MRYMVTINLVKGQQEAIAARMPAEQAHVRALMERGVIEPIQVAADQSRIWLVVPGDSADHVQRIVSDLPLYPYMQVDVTPLLEIPSRR